MPLVMVHDVHTTPGSAVSTGAPPARLPNLKARRLQGLGSLCISGNAPQRTGTQPVQMMSAPAGLPTTEPRCPAFAEHGSNGGHAVPGVTLQLKEQTQS